MNVNEKKQALDLQATIATQKQTIERLADALEFALAYTDRSGDGNGEWQTYAYKCWPLGWSVNDMIEAESAARALLAEIRGAK